MSIKYLCDVHAYTQAKQVYMKNKINRSTFSKFLNNLILNNSEYQNPFNERYAVSYINEGETCLYGGMGRVCHSISGFCHLEESVIVRRQPSTG